MTIFGLNAVVTTIMHSTENKFEEYGKMCRLQHNVLSTMYIYKYISNDRNADSRNHEYLI